MPRFGLLGFMAALVVGAAAGGGEAAMTAPKAAPPLAPARDGNIAIAEELDAARRSGTLAAYDLFLARHPDHPLAATARRERRLIAGRRPRDPK